mmetsp:Transcript_13836/g.30757  ORF Transcript_13836/g.30757 Transcript_13836/m.30757 type:complete len:535 (+) Transcript_13836:149-1753(+)
MEVLSAMSRPARVHTALSYMAAEIIETEEAEDSCRHKASEDAKKDAAYPYSTRSGTSCSDAGSGPRSGSSPFSDLNERLMASVTMLGAEIDPDEMEFLQRVGGGSSNRQGATASTSARDSRPSGGGSTSRRRRATMATGTSTAGSGTAYFTRDGNASSKKTQVTRNASMYNSLASGGSACMAGSTSHESRRGTHHFLDIVADNERREEEERKQREQERLQRQRRQSLGLHLLPFLSSNTSKDNKRADGAAAGEQEEAATAGKKQLPELVSMAPPPPSHVTRHMSSLGSSGSTDPTNSSNNNRTTTSFASDDGSTSTTTTRKRRNNFLRTMATDVARNIMNGLDQETEATDVLQARNGTMSNTIQGLDLEVETVGATATATATGSRTTATKDAITAGTTNIIVATKESESAPQPSVVNALPQVHQVIQKQQLPTPTTSATIATSASSRTIPINDDDDDDNDAGDLKKEHDQTKIASDLAEIEGLTNVRWHQAVRQEQQRRRRDDGNNDNKGSSRGGGGDAGADDGRRRKLGATTA